MARACRPLSTTASTATGSTLHARDVRADAQGDAGASAARARRRNADLVRDALRRRGRAAHRQRALRRPGARPDPVERTITRWAAVDVELGGDSIRRGDLVIAVIGSANRDASQFADPDILDLRREEGKHVGFGRGPHFCLGAALARLETEIALETPLEGLLNLRLAIAEEDLYWLPIPIFRSLESLPVAWDA